MPNRPIPTRTHSLKAKLRLFSMPPISDALVLGRKSPIGCVAIRRAVALLVADPFVHMEIPDDDIVSDILVRESILRRLPEALLRKFILSEVRPLMSDTEIVHLEIEAEVSLEKNL